MQIYLLVAYGGSYDDAWESVHKASFDQNKLIAEAADKNAKLDVKRRQQDEYDEFRTSWEKANPPPEVPEVVYDHLPVPKLPNNQKNITPELRAEKNRIVCENERRRSEASEIARKPFNTWDETVRQPAIAKWFADRGLNPDEFTFYHNWVDSNRGYRVDAVPFEE